MRGVPELIEGDVTAERIAIAGRYLGEDRGSRFAAERKSPRGVLLRLRADDPRLGTCRRSCRRPSPPVSLGGPKLFLPHAPVD